MSDTYTTTDSNSISGTAQTNPNAELRAYADRLKEENEKLFGEVIKTRLEAIGLSPAEGLGKAIAKEYEGEFDIDSVREYAKNEYGYQMSEPTVDPKIVTEASKRLDNVIDTSHSLTPDSEPDPVEEAERRLIDKDATSKDAQGSLNAKLNEFMANRP